MIATAALIALLATAPCDDFTMTPVVTRADGPRLTLCSIIPAAYQTPGNALDQALAANRARAAELCATPFERGRPRVTLPSRYAVKVEQGFECL